MDFNSNIVSLDGIRMYANVVFGEEVVIYCSFPMTTFLEMHFQSLLGGPVLLEVDNEFYQVIIMLVYRKQIRGILSISDWREDGF